MQVFDITLEGCRFASPAKTWGFPFKLSFLSLGLWTKGLAAAATSPICLHKGATNCYFFLFLFGLHFLQAARVMDRQHSVGEA